MKITSIRNTARLVAAAAIGATTQANAQSITNGGFESGMTGWHLADQLGSDGTFLSQSGAASPLNAFTVPTPPEGTHAAMTDSAAGGSHALYQDFTVPAGVTGATLRFSLFLNNGAETYFNPTTLDWAGTNTNGTLNLNQQARVDVITTAGDVFSVAAADILMNLFATTSSTPAVMGYTPFELDLTALLQAHAGETLRLRFAEVDNVNFFNLGVDNVSLTIVPTPPAGVAALALLGGLARRRRPAR